MQKKNLVKATLLCASIIPFTGAVLSTSAQAFFIEIVCSQEWVPVCGVDGETYGNECLAGGAGVEIVYEGECSDNCLAIDAPVCGSDGATYYNSCLAEENGIFDYEDGSCEIVCSQEWFPVCGVDGVTYGNECVAEENGIFDYEDGSCGIVCSRELDPVNNKTNHSKTTDNGVFDDLYGSCGIICSQEWDPVCGVDGATYGNECLADVDSVEIAYARKCKTNSGKKDDIKTNNKPVTTTTYY